jgi:hypothetical protein
MPLPGDNTAEIVTSTKPPAVHVDKLSFRYRLLDDEPATSRKSAAPAEALLEQSLAIEDISFGIENLNTRPRDASTH